MGPLPNLGKDWRSAFRRLFGRSFVRSLFRGRNLVSGGFGGLGGEAGAFGSGGAGLEGASDGTIGSTSERGPSGPDGAPGKVSVVPTPGSSLAKR